MKPMATLWLWASICCAVWALLVLVWMGVNIRYWRRPPSLPSGSVAWEADHVDPTSAPLLSILIPARNEERNIERCLVSISKQVGLGSAEVIVLDDRSQDRTPDLLQQLQKDVLPQLQVLNGKELPEGWTGKNYACQQLAEASRGKWLLFIDADTLFEPDALLTLLKDAQKHEAGLLTGFPRVVTQSLWGWLVIPLLFFIIVHHLPLFGVSRLKDSRFAAAHGAFMLYRRNVYQAIGGHYAYKSALVEDMVMAKAVKEAGYSLRMVDLTSYVSCEMYRSLREIDEGFGKNLFLGIGRSTTLLILLTMYYMAAYMGPVVGMGISAAVGHIPSLLGFLLAYCFTVSQKALCDVKFGTPLRWSWLLPFSILLLVRISWISWRRTNSSNGLTWKGRQYRL